MHYSRTDTWAHPRPYTDASLRRMKHGKLLPMQPAGLTRKSMALAALSGLLIMSGFFTAIFAAAAMFE